MLFPFYLLILPMSGQAFYWSAILVLFASVWTDFNVDEYIIRMRLQCCCIWIQPLKANIAENTKQEVDSTKQEVGSYLKNGAS